MAGCCDHESDVFCDEFCSSYDRDDFCSQDLFSIFQIIPHNDDSPSSDAGIFELSIERGLILVLNPIRCLLPAHRAAS